MNRLLDNSSVAGDVRAFVDGAEQIMSLQHNGKACSGNFVTNTLYFMSHAGTSLFGAGKLDDVRVYNRAPSADEIKRPYNGGR